MFDDALIAHTNLCHDMPCTRCGHARHTFLACSDDCACVPSLATSVVAPPRVGRDVA